MSERDAVPADAAAIRALFRASFTETFGHLYAPHDLAAFFAPQTEAAWAAEIAQGDIRFRVAEEAGRVIGFAKLQPVKLPVAPQGPAAELGSLYVDAAHHGRGVAARLMDWAVATARREGAREMFLSVYVDNLRAKRFYERYGFVDIGRYDFPVGSQIDEDRLMRAEL